MTRLTVRVDLDEEAAFGPGKARLLETIEETGSIRSAAARMDMSYRRAWLLLQETQQIFGVEVIATATGGKKGGGSRLTENGRRIVDCYRQIESNAARASASEMKVLSELSSRSKRRSHAAKKGQSR
jgi:molybdate transport system regulatory protein